MRKKKINKNVIKGRWFNINKKIKKRLVAKYLGFYQFIFAKK